LTAVKQNGFALEFASEELKGDEKVQSAAEANIDFLLKLELNAHLNFHEISTSASHHCVVNENNKIYLEERRQDKTREPAQEVVH